MDDPVGFEIEPRPRRPRRWRLPVLALLLVLFLVLYHWSLPDQEMAGQYAGDITGKWGNISFRLRLGQSGRQLFGDCSLVRVGKHRTITESARLNGWIRRDDFELQGLIDSTPGQVIRFEGGRGRNVNNGLPQLGGKCWLERQNLRGAFVGNYDGPWSPPAVLKLEP